MKNLGGFIMKLKPLNLVVISVFLIYAVAFQNSCNWSSTNYTLTVIIEEGISGTPETGTYEYKEFSEVEYEYEMAEGSVQPEIYFNSSRSVDLSGSVVMYCDIVMTIRQVDIRAQWILSLLNEGGDVTKEWLIEFTGSDLHSGTFTDDRGYSGTWQVTDSNDLTITYNDWENYIFYGTLTDFGGDWENGESSASWYMLLKD